jgi:DeoR/GlpR family transcriptional regulator of sugar metabolism
MASRFLEGRQNQILELIQQDGRVTVQELCKYFKTSAVTIRSDLNTLEKLGRISRIHGGAVINSSGSSLNHIKQTNKENLNIKKSISRCAAELVQDGEVIFLSGGTTCTEIYPFLTDKKHITVITPNLEAAYWLIKTSEVDVFLIGGHVDPEHFTAIGPIHTDDFRNWNIAKVFISAYGISDQSGLTDVKPSMITDYKSFLSSATTVVALVDSSKWGLTSMITTFSLDDLDILITDQFAPPEMKQSIKNHEIRLIQAGKKTEVSV